MRRLISRLGAGFVLLQGGLAWAVLEWLPHTGYYPFISLSRGPGLTVEFLMSGESDRENCQSKVVAMSRSLATGCVECKVESHCEQGLPAFHRLALSHAALDVVSMRIRNGVILFRAGRQDEAAAACSASQRQMDANVVLEPCSPAGVQRGRQVE